MATGMVTATSENLVGVKRDGRIAQTETAVRQREIHVLQVFSVLGMGGAETWLMSLLRYFRDHEDDLPVKVKFDILLTGGTKAVFDDEAVALGAKLFYVPFTRRTLPSFARKFRKILAEGNYDAIHDHQDYIAGLHFLVGGKCLPGVRVAHIHNPLYHRSNYQTDLLKSFAISAGKRSLRKFATHVMGTSRRIVSEYGLDDLEKAGVVLGAAHCGFDVTQYQGDSRTAHQDLCRELGWPETSKIILFVGRLDGAEVLEKGRSMTHKNPAFALEIANECLAEDERIRMVLVGAGESKRREFEALVNQWGHSESIRFLGVRSDVARLMLASNLLLFPSIAEGLGMVVVEAQAAGLRVLSSDTTPRECVVEPGLVEFMSLDENARSWADRILNIFNHADDNFFEGNARVSASPFSIENSANKLLQIYTNS